MYYFNLISYIINNMNVNEILSKSRKQTESLLTTNKGTKKESIYKESIFDTLSDKEKKSARKKVRNYVHSIFESIINADKESKKANIFFITGGSLIAIGAIGMMFVQFLVFIAFVCNKKTSYNKLFLLLFLFNYFVFVLFLF